MTTNDSTPDCEWTDPAIAAKSVGQWIDQSAKQVMGDTAFEQAVGQKPHVLQLVETREKR